VDNVGEIDFGIGDESYKSKWVTCRRELWSITAYNPDTVYGRLGMVKRLVHEKYGNYITNCKKGAEGK
jgi:CelD/BcsL family acetyltransferase involved in cellulose biosynthesis